MRRERERQIDRRAKIVVFKAAPPLCNSEQSLAVVARVGEESHQTQMFRRSAPQHDRAFVILSVSEESKSKHRYFGFASV